MNSFVLPYIMGFSILLQFASAALAIILIFRSGFYKPWIPISAAVLLMGVRRLSSLIGMVERGVFPQQQEKPETIALVISILMLVGLVFFVPAFRKLITSHSQEISKKEVLIRETYHHVKNDLQLLQSLVSLQEDSARTKVQKSFLKDLTLRIQAFVLIHGQLYGKETQSLSARRYFTTLIEGIVEAYEMYDVDLSIDICEAKISNKNLLYLGLVANEAITNSFKYAFHGVESPTLSVRAWVEEDRLRAGFQDNGPGISKQILCADRPSYGISMIQSIGSSDGWTLEISGDEGTKLR